MLKFCTTAKRLAQYFCHHKPPSSGILGRSSFEKDGSRVQTQHYRYHDPLKHAAVALSPHVHVHIGVHCCRVTSDSKQTIYSVKTLCQISPHPLDVVLTLSALSGAGSINVEVKIQIRLADHLTTLNRRSYECLPIKPSHRIQHIWQCI